MAAAVQEVEQTESNAVIVRNVVLTTAAFALQDLLIVDEEVSNLESFSENYSSKGMFRCRLSAM